MISHKIAERITEYLLLIIVSYCWLCAIYSGLFISQRYLESNFVINNATIDDRLL